MRATPASRSTRAVGSGDWWNDVNTTASSNRRPARRATSRSRSAAHTAGGSASTHGLAQVSTSATPGSSAAAPAPSGPHSIVTSARAATARTAGPARSTSPAPSRRTTSTRVMRTPSGRPPCRRWSTASTNVRRTTGAARISSGRVTAVGTSTLATPAARAASTSLPMSPTKASRCGSSPSARAASRSIPGRGFRHRQPSSGVCGQVRQTSNGPSRRSTSAFTAATAAAVRRPRPIPDWLVTTPVRTPAARSLRSAGGAAGIGRTRDGSAQ